MKTCQLKPKVLSHVPFTPYTYTFYSFYLAIIPENIKREVLQEISRFLESNLP